MDLRFTPEQERFRVDARAWLTDRLDGAFAAVRGRGGPGDEHAFFDERWEWEQELGRDGWIGLGWPAEHGGRGATLVEQMIFFEEYARAGGPGRVGIVGEGLLGPTIVHFGSDAQRQSVLPGILRGTEIWCQGYSEPDAGSDLANVKTRAVLDGDEWVITGQKVWTSLAHWAQWIFVIARTNPDAPKHKGLSYLLVPMDQPGIEIRPIVQITGHSEFNETFLDGARTHVSNVVGEVDDGWRVAMGTLAFERGASTLGQQLAFEEELRTITERARGNGGTADPSMRQRLADAWITLRVMQYHALRTLPALEHGTVTPATSIHKLFWATFHRALGELAIDVCGPHGVAGYDEALEGLFLYSRADTIYGGSNQIQRNVIGEARVGVAEGATMTNVPEYPPARGLLAGKTVLVTAAAGTGIGFATAKRCTEEGARVAITDIHERRLRESAEEIGALAVLANVASQADVDRCFADVTAAFGHIDVLVNNAGLGGTARLAEMTDEQWSSVLDVTLTGTMRMTRAALKLMGPRGSGAIVNNASVVGWRAQAGQSHYAAAKAGVMALTRCAAIEAAEQGVRVNAVAPSLAMHAHLAKVTTEELLAELTTQEAFGRAAEPWEVANVIVFLASDLSSYLTGEVLSVSSQHP